MSIITVGQVLCALLDRKAGALPAELALGTVVSSMYQHVVKRINALEAFLFEVSGLMLKLLAMACVTHILSKTCNKQDVSTHMGPYPYYRTQWTYWILCAPGPRDPST